MVACCQVNTVCLRVEETTGSNILLTLVEQEHVEVNHFVVEPSVVTKQSHLLACAGHSVMDAQATRQLPRTIKPFIVLTTWSTAVFLIRFCGMS